MQLEELIFTALTGGSPPPTEVGVRVYALIAEEGSDLPRITFQRITSTPTTALDGNNNLDQVRFQVDSWSRDYLEAKRVASQAREVLESQSFKALMTTDFDDYEPETRLYRVRQDYRCWYRPMA